MFYSSLDFMFQKIDGSSLASFNRLKKQAHKCLVCPFEQRLERPCYNSCHHPPSRGGGGGTPCSGLYGEAPPKRGTFFRLQVYKRVGISAI